MSQLSPLPENLQKVERQTRQLQAANLVGREVASILDLNELLPRMVDIICETYDFYYAGVFLLDETRQWAVLRAGRGQAGKALIAEGHKLEVGGHSMIGWATGHRQARIALDVGEEAVHFRNPHLPHTRSEMALPLVAGNKVVGALTVQSTQERAFSEEDILTLQTMADHLAVAINNAYLVRDLERANAELLRAKTYEALTAATTQAIHWIGNRTLPMTTAIQRLKSDLASDRPDLASCQEDLDLLADSVRQIVEVKENLLGPVREQRPRPAMLADLVQAAALQAGVPAAMLRLEIAANTPLVLADTAQLVRVLCNLFRNALEARASQIAVALAPAPNDEVAIHVNDNGEGIPAEMCDKVWAAFVTTKSADHSGLGLPAALLVVNQLHGSIRLTSHPGKGTSFHLLLPAAHDSSKLALKPGSAPHILLVDDDDAWARFASLALGVVGCTVMQGLEFQGTTPDQIWVDEALEVQPIQEVLAHLKAAGVLDRTIVISAAPQVERVTRYLQMGVREAALKPYSLGELGALIG